MKPNSYQRFFCITFHGTILTCSKLQEQIQHAPLHNSILEDAVEFFLGHVNQSSAFSTDATAFDHSDSSADRLPLAHYTVFPISGNRLVHLHDGWGHPCANASGKMERRPSAQGWETFLLISEDELRALLFVCENRWLENCDGLPISGGKFESRFSFLFDSKTLDLSQGQIICFPEDDLGDGRINRHHSFVLLKDGWKIYGRYYYSSH